MPIWNNLVKGDSGIQGYQTKISEYFPGSWIYRIFSSQKFAAAQKLPLFFSEVKVSVSFPMPSHPYPQLVSMKSPLYSLFASS
jgi:hypothetical protein